MGLRLLQRRLGPVQVGGVCPRIDLEEHLPLLDFGPFFVQKEDFVEIAGHAGAKIDARQRLGMARKVLVIGNFLHHGLADDHLGRFCRRRRRRPAPATEHQQRPQQRN